LVGRIVDGDDVGDGSSIPWPSRSFFYLDC